MLSKRSDVFTNKYPAEINDLIISYLPPGDLKSLICTKSFDIEEQFFIKKPAIKALENMNDVLLPSLIRILQHFPEHKIEKTYDKLYKANEESLISTIQNFFLEDGTIPPDVLCFFQECLVHCCYKSREKMGLLLNKYIHFQDERNTLVNYLIEADADPNQKDAKSLSTLDKAIIYQLPAETICKLISHGAKPRKLPETEGYKGPLTYFKIKYSTMILAALLCPSEVISHLAKRFPNEVDETIRVLTIMHDSPSWDWQYQYGNKKVEFTKSQLKNGLGKLVVGLKDESLMTPANKNAALSYITYAITNADNIETCLDLYNRHVNEIFLNHQNYPRINYVMSFFSFNACHYTQEKKQFIEMIQEKIYTLVNSNEFIHSFDKPSKYFQACKKIIEHPVFSDDHDKQGINSKYKNLFQEKVIELENMLFLPRYNK